MEVALSSGVHAGDKFIAIWWINIYFGFLLIYHLFEFVLYNLMPFMFIMIIVFNFW